MTNNHASIESASSQGAADPPRFVDSEFRKRFMRALQEFCVEEPVVEKQDFPRAG